MTDQLAPVTRTLERVAEVHGDPYDLVYAELFRRFPEFRPLFVLDASGAVRGNMLANVIAVLLDLEDDRNYGLNMLRAERINHENLGVPPAQFFTFLDVLKASVATALAAEWTAEKDAAWEELIALAKTAGE